MGKIYINPFNWGYVEDNTLIYENPTDEAEVKEMIDQALSDAVDDIVGEAVNSMDIKLEGENLKYKLVVNGNENGEIDIPKDQFLKSVTYDKDNKQLIFVMETSDGEATTEVAISDLVASIEDGVGEIQGMITEINNKNDEQDSALDLKADASALAEKADKSELQAVEAKVDAIDLTPYATKADVEESYQPKGDYLTEHQDLSEYAKSADVQSALDLKADKTEVEAVDAKVDAIVIPDVSGFATKEELSEVETALNQEAQRATSVEGELQGKDTELQANIDTLSDKVDAIVIPDVSGFATKTEVQEGYQPKGDYLTEHQDLSDYAKTADVQSALDLKADKTEVEAVDAKVEAIDLTPYATKADVQTVDDKVEAIVIPDVSGFAIKSEVSNEIDAVSDALSQFETQVEAALDLKADVSALVDLATKSEVESAAANAVAQIVANAPEDFDTLKEVADYIASDKTKASEIESKLAQHDATIETLATKAEVQALETALNEEVQRATSVEGELQGKDVELQANIDALDAKVEAIVVPSVEGLASEDYVDEKVGEKADASELAALALVVNNKPNTSDIPTKTSELTNDSGFITNHQSLEDYASKAYVSGAIADVIGTAPETLDTLGEIANALADNATMTMVSEAISTKANSDDVYTKGEIDNKIGNLGEVIEVEGQEATYWEDGDELPEGVEVGDVKTPAVDEVKREKSVKEYVDESVQTVNEKPEVMVLERKYGALLTLLNLRDTDINNTIVNQELAESNAVTYEDGSIDNIVVPETTKSKTITAELEPDTDLTLTSRYGVTINNTSDEATNLNVTAPAVENYNAATITLNGGEYDTITVTDASLTVQNGASVQNVVITQETTKNLTVNAIFAEGATVTSSSNAAITLTSKNGEGEEVSVVLDAPGATVTMNNGNWVNVEAAVSANTLIINKNVHIENLNVTQGNVIVKVARQADIANVVENYTLASGYTIDHLHDDITASNVSNLTATGTHTLTEDIAKSGRFAPGIFASDDIVWNLNGHNITFTNTQGYANFLLRGSLHLEINGEGNVINNAGDYGFWAAAEGVKIVINGGHFEAATHVLYAEKGTIEVNGGSFKLTNPDECDKDVNGNFKFLLNCKDENYTAGKANIIVRGGKFYDFNPAVSYGEPNGPVSFVAEGYGVVESTEMINGVEHKVFEVKPING